MISIITKREREIITKKIKGLSLTQNESNILSKSIRPKLNEVKKIKADYLLNRLEYNQKSKSVENKIKKLILENLSDVQAIALYGSAIQTNYKNYNDLDIMIVTKKKLWDSLGEKYDLITKLSNASSKLKLNIDFQIIDKDALYINYSSSPSLIYQLADHKLIYGKLNIPKEIKLPKLILRMKLDWSDLDDIHSKGKEIYNSLRNIILVRLLMNRIVDNEALNEEVKMLLGINLINKLKNNSASKTEKKIVLEDIKNLSQKTDREIQEAKWEKIAL